MTQPPGDFRLLVFLFVVVGVPASVAIAVFLVGVFAVLLAGGGSVDVAGAGFWSGVAFVVGPLFIVTIAARASARVRRGEPSFLSPRLSRAVPGLLVTGLIGAAALGSVARREYVEQLENEAVNFCGSDPSCRREALSCLRQRPIDETPHTSSRKAALAKCLASAPTPKG